MDRLEVVRTERARETFGFTSSAANGLSLKSLRMSRTVVESPREKVWLKQMTLSVLAAMSRILKIGDQQAERAIQELRGTLGGSRKLAGFKSLSVVELGQI